MIVIARVKSVTKHQYVEDNENLFCLNENETYFRC